MKSIEAFDIAIEIIRKARDVEENVFSEYNEAYEKLIEIRNNIPAIKDLSKLKRITFDSYEDEVFKPVPGYEDLYEVSNKCRIKSLKNRNRILLGSINKGYLMVALTKDGKTKNFRLSRVVASAWIPNPDGKPYIDHVNSNCLDDRPENLRWVTQVENMSNSETRKIRVGIYGKEVLQFTKEGSFVRAWTNAFVAQHHIGINNNNIRSCCQGKAYEAGGFVWRYKDSFNREFKEGDRIPVDFVQKESFNFFNLGLHIGDEIQYREDSSVIATICDKTHVFYNNTKYSLTVLIKRLRNTKQ